MDEPLTLYELPPSPNNVRARLALKIKGLRYTRELVSNDDRSALVALSGQPLTPVLTHGARVIYDSSAILRYLDANFPHEPRLFSPERSAMQQIERWELHARSRSVLPVGLTFEQAFADSPDSDALARANALLMETTESIERALETGPWLLGAHLSAADLFPGPLVSVAMLQPDEVAEGPSILQFFAAHLQLGSGRDRTRDWVQRLRAFDT